MQKDSRHSATTIMIDQEKRAADLSRRKNQMLLFGGATLATLASCRLTARGIASRRYLPQMFQANHMPPQSDMVKEAAMAVVFATTMALSSFSMVVFGVAWSQDVTSLKQFALKMKTKLGAQQIEDEIRNAPMTPETQELQDQLAGALKKD
ncbi:Altered inheritance of mitochondria protein 11 [Yarrowia sp. C11]|nr:Altered inheritance of mitochondria protein 11 [Yarrowia sp. C11]KAG5364263.1 Altered inheritance of mitochondria protein 11 [Yarrowia sp. E02]